MATEMNNGAAINPMTNLAKKVRMRTSCAVGGFGVRIAGIIAPNGGAKIHRAARDYPPGSSFAQLRPAPTREADRAGARRRFARAERGPLPCVPARARRWDAASRFPKSRAAHWPR